jgi:hypothetical protein
MSLPHFSVSSAMSLPKSAGEDASTSPPRLASRASILGSARPALIYLDKLERAANMSAPRTAPAFDDHAVAAAGA